MKNCHTKQMIFIELKRLYFEYTEEGQIELKTQSEDDHPSNDYNLF